MSEEMPLHVVYTEARIRKGDKFLLAKRSSHDDQAAGQRSVPGGKAEMDLGHHIIENTLKREVMEEVGVEVGNFQFLGTEAFIRSSGHHVIGIAFVVDHISGEAQALEDHEEVRRVTIDEIETLFPKHRKETIEKLKRHIKSQ